MWRCVRVRRQGIRCGQTTADIVAAAVDFVAVVAIFKDGDNDNLGRDLSRRKLDVVP